MKLWPSRSGQLRFKPESSRSEQLATCCSEQTFWSSLSLITILDARAVFQTPVGTVLALQSAHQSPSKSGSLPSLYALCGSRAPTHRASASRRRRPYFQLTERERRTLPMSPAHPNPAWCLKCSIPRPPAHGNPELDHGFDSPSWNCLERELS